MGMKHFQRRQDDDGFLDGILTLTILCLLFILAIALAVA